jgi:hypothetical protein
MYLDHEGNRKGDISPSWGQPNTRVHICTTVVAIVPLLIQLIPRAQNVPRLSRLWRKLHRWYKPELRPPNTRFHIRTIEAPCTLRSREGNGTNTAFMPPRTMKILGKGRPRGPRRAGICMSWHTQKRSQIGRWRWESNTWKFPIHSSNSIWVWINHKTGTH